jgi:hypothetical protein
MESLSTKLGKNLLQLASELEAEAYHLAADDVRLYVRRFASNPGFLSTNESDGDTMHNTWNFLSTGWNNLTHNVTDQISNLKGELSRFLSDMQKNQAIPPDTKGALVYTLTAATTALNAMGSAANSMAKPPAPSPTPGSPQTEEQKDLQTLSAPPAPTSTAGTPPAAPEAIKSSMSASWSMVRISQSYYRSTQESATDLQNILNMANQAFSNEPNLQTQLTQFTQAIQKAIEILQSPNAGQAQNPTQQQLQLMGKIFQWGRQHGEDAMKQQLLIRVQEGKITPQFQAMVLNWWVKVQNQA